MSVNERERSRDRDHKRERPTRFSDSSRDRSIDRGKDDAGFKSSLCQVYVSNIPYEYRWQDLKDLFRSEVGDVTFVELFVDESEKPRGCGIVEFSDPESVKKCLEVMHRFEIKGRKLVIKEDFGNQRDKYGNLVGTAASKRARDRDSGRDRFRDRRRDLSSIPVHDNRDCVNSKWENMYGLSSKFLDSLGIRDPPINRVFVANLDYKVDKKKLKEIFRLAGKIQRIDLSSDKDGKSRGFAVIEYDHPVEAVQAISMFHNRVLYDRAMTVRIDREGDRAITKLPDGLKGIGMGLGSNGEPLRDVTRNLPAAQNSTNSISTLGSVQSLQLGIGNPLSSLSNTSAFGALNTNAVLQAANLVGVGGLTNNLLTSGLVGVGNLGISSPRLANNHIQNDSLTSFIGSRNLGNNSNYSRTELGGIQSLSSQNKVFLNEVGHNQDRMGKRPSTGGMGKSSRYSNKIVINNFPSSVSFRMLKEKCSEFGDVENIEDKGGNGIHVTFGSDWAAENAINNLDQARVDGRIIDVRFF